MKNEYVNDFVDSVQIYHKELDKYDILKTQEEEYDLILKAKDGDINARNKILEAHLRFVMNIAKKYNGRGVEMGDLISEGNLGLIKAIEKFDITRNVRFSVCAYWWIESAMIEFWKKQTKKDNHEVQEDEVMNERVWDNKFCDEDDDVVIRRESFFGEEVKQYVNELKTQESQLINDLLESLTSREQYIIKSYFGLENERMTLGEIGEILDLSKERVRQCKKAALRKLRSEILSYDLELSQIFNY